MKELDRFDLSRLISTRPIRWKAIGEILAKKYGKERITHDDAKTSITFNLQDPLEFSQLNQFGEIALSHGIKITHDFSPEGKIIESFLRHNDKSKLTEFIKQIEVRTILNTHQETLRPVMPEEPQSILHDVTGRNWQHVENSKYGEPVLEPREYSPGTPGKRDNQIAGLGLAFSAQKKPSWRDWKHHVNETEAGSKQPRTVIPRRWIKERADYQPNSNLAQQLQQSFKSR